MQQLTRDFFLHEFTRSQIAARMGRAISPSPDELSNLIRLCELVLQPLRADVGRPITILSGLRPLWLNAALPNASKTSAHIFGRAADLVVQGMTPLEVCRRVAALRLPVDQVIHEYPPNGWSHIAIPFRDVAPRLQYLTARSRSGSTIYEKGLFA